MFIDPDHAVIPLQLRDYPEWHHGRDSYALWYIELHTPGLMAYYQQLRAQFSDFLIADAQRQPHITLFVNGFLTQQINWDDDFSLQQMQQQISLLQQQKLSPFKLALTGIDSFSSSLFIQVQDNHGILQQLRGLLARTQQEIAALSYYPHITLGFYRQAFMGQQIIDCIQQIDFKMQTIMVEQLRLGVYDAKTLQGRLSTIYQLDLVN